jgi:hypothetical protein
MKYYVIAGCSLLWLIVSIVRIPDNPRQNADIGIDASWVLALPEMLRNHSISGRDFHFTYGPLSQALAYAGAALHTPWSVISSLPLIVFAFYAASIILMAAILFLVKDFGWKECLFLYAATAGLNLFSEPTAFRPLAVMFCAVLLYRALESRPGFRKWAWSATTGAACFAAHLLTFEMGLYSILTVAAVGLIGLVLKDRAHRRPLLASIGIVFAVYLAANLAIDCYFILTSPYYRLFDYQYYALETIRGFGFSQSLPWELNAITSICLAIVALFAVGAAIFMISRVNAPGRFWILPLLVCAVIELKSMMVRSDLDHITQSCSPIVFLLLGVGAIFIYRGKQFKIPLILWVAVFALLLGCWPWAGLYFVKDLHRAATIAFPFGKFARLRGEVVRPDAVLPEGISVSGAIPPGPLLAFPYENYIPIALQRRIVAPVPMAYNASTESLQQFYIKSLERERGLSVIYGLDGVASTAVDGIPIVTRAPAIFDYLYTHFRLSEKKRFGKGFYLLQRNPEPRCEWQKIQVSANLRKVGRSVWEVQLTEPITCNLLRLDIEIDYPWWQYLGNPSPLEFLFFRSGTPFLKTGLYAIKPNAPFMTIISLMPEARFIEILGSGKAATRTWDQLRISPRAADPLGVWPSKVDIRSLACLLDKS